MSISARPIASEVKLKKIVRDLCRRLEDRSRISWDTLATREGGPQEPIMFICTPEGSHTHFVLGIDMHDLFRFPRSEIVEDMTEYIYMLYKEGGYG